uniref:Uncharacterized protein n=1 Tax=Nelumbo nucifera TaxID=4432 RepID=A0A822XQT5_NELNU|nr:TPA_asm: hypothetical protein HUJ06_023496 [Nelumbo nucifera]
MVEVSADVFIVRMLVEDPKSWFDKGSSEYKMVVVDSSVDLRKRLFCAEEVYKVDGPLHPSSKFVEEREGRSPVQCVWRLRRRTIVYERKEGPC